MTCETCTPECPFRWREWTKDSFAIGLQKSAASQSTSTQVVDEARAAGVDRSFIHGIGKATAMADVSKLVVVRPKRKHGPALTVKRAKS